VGAPGRQARRHGGVRHHLRYTSRLYLIFQIEIVILYKIIEIEPICCI
jgi:hypothetical protein